MMPCAGIASSLALQPCAENVWAAEEAFSGAAAAPEMPREALTALPAEGSTKECPAAASVHSDAAELQPSLSARSNALSPPASTVLLPGIRWAAAESNEDGSEDDLVVLNTGLTALEDPYYRCRHLPI